MKLVRICQKNSVDLVDMLLQFVDNAFRAFFVPSTVKEESEVVHLEQIAMRRVVQRPRNGAEFDDGRHFIRLCFKGNLPMPRVLFKYAILII